MNQVQLKKLEIISNLSFVPANKLEEISNFIQRILIMNKTEPKKPISIRDIWKGAGFEKLDIEKELKDIRTEVQKSLDSKEYC